jgi:mannitol/fructose-specific phosphotransferase system IIA component (Ntr-type)
MTNSVENLDFPTVDLPLSAVSSPAAAVTFLVGQLVQRGKLSAEKPERIVCQILRRESQGSTAIGYGLAIPHSKSEVVDEVLAA